MAWDWADPSPARLTGQYLSSTSMALDPVSRPAFGVCSCRFLRGMLGEKESPGLLGSYKSIYERASDPVTNKILPR